MGRGEGRSSLQCPLMPHLPQSEHEAGLQCPLYRVPPSPTPDEAASDCTGGPPEGNGERNMGAPPPAEWSPADLGNAALLNLAAVPRTPAAVALVEELTAAVADLEAGTRGNRRGAAGRAKLHDAVGAVVGGLLRAWDGGTARACFHPLNRSAFTGGPVGHRQFTAAVAGLEALGHVARHAGINYAFAWEDGPSFVGKAARFRPAAPLLALAARHGVTPGTARDAFGTAYPTKPPAVHKPLLLRGLPAPRRKGTGARPERQELPIRAGDATARRLAEQVRDANARADRHDVRGCLPPRWRRAFVLDWCLGGRWASVGGAGHYQSLSPAERAGITIDGARTVELDVTAAHLTVMHGLLGVPMPVGDPYTVPGVPRDVAKAWIVAALGKGSPVTRWAATAEVDPARWLAREVGAVILARYPFLSDPAAAVCDLAHLGPPRRLLTHRLMGLEAAAITAAMERLWAVGTLALPVHDSLIVPAGAVEPARQALVEGFEAVAGATPVLKPAGVARSP